MNDIIVSECIKNIIYHIVIFLLSFGWIILFIINKLINLNETLEFALNLVVITIIFILGVIKELKDIEYKFKQKDKKIIEQKKKILAKYKEQRIKLIKQYIAEKEQLENKYLKNENYQSSLAKYLAEINLYVENN